MKFVEFVAIIELCLIRNGEMYVNIYTDVNNELFKY